MSHKMMIQLLFLFGVHQVHSQVPIDYSIQSIQKCKDSEIPDSVSQVVVPPHRMSISSEFRFRLTEKCATRLPHCVSYDCTTSTNAVTVELTPIIAQAQDLPSNTTPTHFADDDEGGGDDVGVGRNSSDYYGYEVDADPVILFTPKGFLRVEDEYFSSGDDYCVHAYNGSHIVVQVCSSRCGGGGGGGEELTPFIVCVPKCCSLHKVFDVGTDSCKTTSMNTVPWAPPVYQSPSRQICGEKRANLKFHYFQRPPDCDNYVKYFLKNVQEDVTRVRFRLLTNGSVVLKDLYGDTWNTLADGSYCLDGVIGEDGEYTGDPTDQVLLVCSSHAYAKGGRDEADGNLTFFGETRLTGSGIAYVVLLFSGVPFLFVTCLFYVLVWGLQNVHGWTQFSHTLAMLLHYLSQAVANFVSRILSSEQNASTCCAVVGVLTHYFVLASFFWLTVINYDLFSMFRHLKTTVGRSRGIKRFIVYSVVAWGVPFAVVLVSVVLDQLYGLYGDDRDCQVDVVVPLYGHNSCYMVPDARPLYLYYPVGVIMCLNLVLAGCTVFNMHRHDTESRNAHGEFKRNTKHRRKFLVFAKLFVVFGVVWVFELFVWSFIKRDEVLPWYLVFPDVFNVFQAVAIFFLFACQPKILGQVADKYPRLEGFTVLLSKLKCGNNSDGNNTASGRSSGGGGSGRTVGGSCNSGGSRACTGVNDARL